MMFFEETRKQLEKLGLPSGDRYDLPTSTKRFPDGAQFRIEVPTVNSPACMKALLEKAWKEYKVHINKIDETFGIMRHTTKDIKEYVAIAKDWGCELNMSTGPRAEYDIGATVKTAQGVRVGYRLRGMENIVRAVEDVKRACDLGVRGILCYDEGFLWVLAELRKAGHLPANLKIKLSAHMGACNPASFQLFEKLGADTINPIRDLTLPMLAALREAVDVPIDLHTDNPPASGGFIRTYDAPEMVRIVSPVYLKMGNSAVAAHGLKTTAEDGKNMADQISRVHETIMTYYPEAKQSEPGQPDMAIPE
ncbi:MAG: peptidase [Firmicutes bacterium]|nr:peptidase [Bacillota bacterium]